MFLAARSVTEFSPDLVTIDPATGVSPAPITAIATSRGTLRSRESGGLLYSDFAYRGSARLVRARVEISRFARVQDRVVQLAQAGSLIGTNQADPAAADVNIYEFSGEFLVTADFGLVIDLGPHFNYPSSTTVYIRSVRLEFID
jgi:hypothetical protein